MKKKTYNTESRTTVVPIINVSLVVVLTLMMISPFLSEEDTDVNLPTARAAEVDDTDNVEITFTLDRQVLVAGEPMDRDGMATYLGTFFESTPNCVALVKADQGLPYGEVEALVAEIKAADAPRIALATRERENEEAAP
ncbi:hypothetical protein CSB20_05795 [bacterium DOLZORAL124_64_63]|nr:MAG: hypothetical protein CSB20_05795 [bacterium DOLZORAL124_64_63]